MGPDTFAHVVKTMQGHLPNDPWHGLFKNPVWLAALIEKARWGKTKCGIYKKKGQANPGARPGQG